MPLTSEAGWFPITVTSRVVAVSHSALMVFTWHERHHSATQDKLTLLEHCEALCRVPPLFLEGSCAFPAAVIPWALTFAFWFARSTDPFSLIEVSSPIPEHDLTQKRQHQRAQLGLSGCLPLGSATFLAPPVAE